MKKLLLLTAIASFSFSSDFEWKFLGLSVASEQVHKNESSTSRALSTQLKLGVQNRDYRVALSYKTDFSKMNEFAVQTDYLFDSFDINDLPARAYVGASLSFIKHKQAKRLMAPGLHTGILVNVSSNIDMDFGYSYKKYRNSDLYRYQNSFLIGFNYFF